MLQLDQIDFQRQSGEGIFFCLLRQNAFNWARSRQRADHCCYSCFVYSRLRLLLTAADLNLKTKLSYVHLKLLSDK